jgi:hypothetical protein
MKLAEARAKLRGKAGGQAGEQGNVLPGQTQPGNVSNYRNFLANVHDNGIMETKSGGGSGSISEEEKSATPGELLTAVMTPEQLAGLPSYKEIVFSMLAEEQKQRANNGEDLFSIFDELGSGKQQQIEQMAQGIYDSLTSQQRKDLIFLGSSYAFAGESLDTRMKVLRWKEENQKEITYEDLVKMGFYTQGEMEDAGREWASLINAEYDQVYHKDTSIAMLDLEQGLQQGMERSMLFAMMAAPIIDRALYGPSDQIFANNIYDNLERQGTAENSKGSMGYIPPTMEENPGEPAMGMENPAGQASKGMTGRYIDNTTDTLTKGEKQVVDDLVRQGKTVERIPVNPKIEGGTPDFNVDGVRTELKTLENANTNTGMKRIQNGFSQGAENVIIDARNSGLTKAQADEVIARTKGKYPNGQLPGTVEIWIDGQVITYP